MLAFFHILLPLILGGFLSIGATFFAIRLAKKLGWLVKPGVRRVHQVETPHLGGVALVFSFAIGVLVWTFFSSDVRWNILPILVGAPLAFCIGLWDDLTSIGSKRKLSAQVVLASLAFFLGFRLDALTLGAGVTFSLGSFALPVTVLWIVVVMNAINLIDGLDGLAAGVCGIIFVGISLLGGLMGNPTVSWFALLAAGGCLGFLWFNFSPAKIFMGDSGSMFLGYLIAILSVSVHTSGAVAKLPIYIPLFLLAVPVADLVVAILRRTVAYMDDCAHRGVQAKARGVLSRICSADGQHIHHRLVSFGYSHPRVAITLYGISILAAAVSVVLVILPRDLSWMVAIVSMIFAWQFILRLDYVEFMPRNERLRAKDLEERRWLQGFSVSGGSHQRGTL